MHAVNNRTMTPSENNTESLSLPLKLKSGDIHTLSASDLPADIVDMMKKPGRAMCGDIDMRIDATAMWHYRGSPINRPGMVKLFSTVLYRDDAGWFWLITPVEMMRITVEDAPFTALEMTASGTGENQSIYFRTNVETEVPLNQNHPLRIAVNIETDEPRPYVTVRDRLEALLVRSVFYQLIEVGTELEVDGETVMGVWSNGMFFPLGSME